MADKTIAEMELPISMANIFSARNIVTAKDALSLTEFELMELLDVDFVDVVSAVAHISAIISPPYRTALLLLEQRIQNDHLPSHLATNLKGLDNALGGGIPFGVVTEVVGSAGTGKTQFCLMMSLLASLPKSHGGVDGHVVYIDVESKFSSRRMIEIGETSFPKIFHIKGMAHEIANRILVLRPPSLSDFMASLQEIKVSHQHKVKLIIIDSMAALVSGECDQRASTHDPLGSHISCIKLLAECSRIPIVVTNQVRSQRREEAFSYSFQAHGRAETLHGAQKHDSHLVAALGLRWAHAVTTRLVFEFRSGHRYMKIAKSPMSPPLAFPFTITSSGILLLDDDGIELHGQEITAIHSRGDSDIIHFNQNNVPSSNGSDSFS